MRTKPTPAWAMTSKVFTLDGEPCDLAEFYVANDVSPEEANAIGRLEVGQHLVFGGGAGAEFILARVADGE